MKIADAYPGKKVGRLTLVKQEGRDKHNHIMWSYICECGNSGISALAHIGYDTFSCGCLMVKNGDSKPGDKYHKLYQCYADIMQRTGNKNNSFYSDYGGRGIKNEFKDYASFKRWALSRGYKVGLSIDRIDVNGNYSSNNCRWVNMLVQGNNRRNTVSISTPYGNMRIIDIYEKYQIPKNIIANRIRAGDSFEEIIRPYTKGKHSKRLGK